MMVEQTVVDDCPDGYEILHSPYRPLPTGAKREISGRLEDVSYHEDRRTVYVSEVPSEELLEKWELEWVRTDDPEETWETKSGQTIEIYADRVEIDGSERSLGPDEARERCREQDHINPLDAPLSDKEPAVSSD